MSKWEMVRLGDVFSSIKNGASIKQGIVSGGYPITRIETISQCVIDRNKMGYAGIEDLSKYKNYILEHGDILMSHINSEKHLGKSAFYERVTQEAIIHGMNLLCLKVIPERLYFKFANYFFCSKCFRVQIPPITKKSVNQASFTVTALKETKIPLPPLEVQKKISQILDAAAELIALRKKQMAELDNLIKSTFYEMFGNPITNEKGWEIVRIKELAKKIQYGTSAKASESEREFPILRMNNITYNGNLNLSNLKFIDLTEEDKEKYLVNKGELLFNRTNSKELVGKTAVFNEDQPMAFAGYLVKLTPNEKANSQFISSFLNSAYGKRLLLSMAKSIVGMANINAKELGNIFIYLPPLVLQNQFAEIVTKIEEQKSLVQKAIDESQYLFDSLMSEYFE